LQIFKMIVFPALQIWKSKCCQVWWFVRYCWQFWTFLHQQQLLVCF